MRHNRSGARLLYLANDDENKTFAIGFKTPPADSTGVFHILEHSVLCGSRKFPVKEPFVNLLKSSMQTFLNAMTFPDKTLYPVASTNEQDLMNLMDVYLDAVFNPLIYHNRSIFEQEGWHYELGGPADTLRYNGVVFNEMKGALSNPDSVLYNTLCGALFPDTAYAHESGGDPESIIDLTYEGYLDTHKRHYRPDNSYLFLYGDMDVDRVLAFLDEEYLSNVENRGDGPNPLEFQQPLKSDDVIKPMQTAEENACIGLGFVVGTAHDRNRTLEVDILWNALLGSNEAPLKRILLDSDLADDVQGYLVDEQLQPLAVIQLKGCHGDVRDTFKTIVQESVERLCQEGIPTEKLEAAISRAEFSVRERDFGVADGVVLAMAALTGWLYDDGMPTAYLRYDEAFAAIREKIGSGYFEQLLREVILDSDHTGLAYVLPVEKLEGISEEEKLAAVKAGLSSEDALSVMDSLQSLRAWQEEPDTSEALATLPKLRLEDIGEARPEPEWQLLEDTPLPCLYHDIKSRHINYVYHYFDLTQVAFDELPYVGILAQLLGKLETAKHSAAEIDYLAQANLGSLRYMTPILDHESVDHVTPLFVVGASALAEKVDYLATLPAEIINSTSFKDVARIRDILQQTRVYLEQGFATAGHSAALQRLASYHTQAAVVREMVDGVEFYRFLKSLLADFEERADDLVRRLEDLSRRIFNRDAVTTGFTGTPEEREHFWEKAGTLDLGAADTAPRLVIPDPVRKNEAFIVPTDICFAAKGYDRRLIGEAFSGIWQVVVRMLSFDYLWSEIRVKGGAYGAGFKADHAGALQFYSYRDPHLDATIDRFDAAAEWLATNKLDEDALLGYIISSVASYDTPKKPRELALRGDFDYFKGLEPNWRKALREETLHTTEDDLKGLAQALRTVAQKHDCCVFGSRDILEKSHRDFEIIDLLAQ